MIDKIELDQALSKLDDESATATSPENDETPLESEEVILRKYAFLIERLSDDDPFKFTLRTNDPHVSNLTFRQIELLIKNEIQLKTPAPIDPAYLNASESTSVTLGSSSKWWVCQAPNKLRQLIDCMCKRGYREKSLAKSLNKLNEDNYNASSEATSLISDAQTGQDAAAFYQNRYLNSAGNAQMFDKQASLLKDFLASQESLQARLSSDATSQNWVMPHGLI